MLIAFFDSDGIINKEFVTVGETMNSAFYEEVLKRLLRHIQRVRPELHRTGQWMLLGVNALVHCATRVHQFLSRRGVPVLDHPPYSPALAPADLFPRRKSMKGARLADVAVIQEHVTAVLRSIPKQPFAEFPEALWTLQRVCCEGWRLFWRPVKIICIFCFVFWYHSPNFLDTPRMCRNHC